MFSQARSLFLAIVWATSACGEPIDQRPAVWEYISPVLLQPNCATTSCHSRAAAAAGLDFSDPDRGYISLTGLKVWIVNPDGTEGCRPEDGTTVCQREFRPLVTPFNPSQSRVVHMLRASGAARMPPDRPFAEVDIALIERWILAGATKSGAGSPPPGLDAGQGSAMDAAGVPLPLDAAATEGGFSGDAKTSDAVPTIIGDGAVGAGG